MTAEKHIEAMANIMRDEAPEGWRELKMRCRYFDDAMEIKTHYRLAGDESWTSYAGGDFTLMDICEALAEETHPGMDDAWTILELRVDSDGSHEFEFGYGDPGIFES